MPYCVLCGVRLKDSNNRCPLCGTPVILPDQYSGKAGNNELPLKRDEPRESFDRDLWVKLVSIILAVPILLTLAIDYFVGTGISWSIYVLTALALVWVWCVSPFLVRRNIFPLWFALDTAALSGFLFFIERLSNTGNWFIPLAFPLLIFTSASIFSIVFLFRKKIIRQLQKPAILLLIIGLLCLFIELIVDRYKYDQYQPGWSFLVAIPCSAFAVILLILQRRQWIVEELKYWFRI